MSTMSGKPLTPFTPTRYCAFDVARSQPPDFLFGVFSLVYAPFFSVFLAHGVGVSQDAKSDLDFCNHSIHEFSFEKQAHVGEAK